MLVVFLGNLSENILFFVLGGSKLAIFVGQILNSIDAIILERRE